MFRPPPSSLLEALQQMIGGSARDDLSSLFAAPMMPQEPSNPFPQGSIQNMDPNALAALEQGLSGAMTNKANLEDAAMQEGRGDLFVNQAANDPERAPFYMEKANLAEGQRREKVENERVERERAALQQQGQIELEGRLLPDLGPELASQMARRLMSGESPTSEEMAAWQQAKFQKEKLAFEEKKRDHIVKAMEQAVYYPRDPKTKEYQKDADGKYLALPMSMAPTEIRDEYRANLEMEIGPGPQAPMAPPSQTISSSTIVERKDPKTGKTIYSNQPIKPKGAIPEKPPMTLVSDTPPKTPSQAKTVGGLTSKIAEFQKPIEKGFKGGYRSPFENKERDKQTMGKQIAMEILTKGIRTGRTPQQIVAEAKLDKSIPPEILKLIEQFAPRM